ncbi:MAG: 1-(5-phosphoribosyl)-5-amino-4-imidazole-carboxylate carboxylase, partial [Candidatus Eisenbacteria bacterium]|nr:1-(5-phosphoribosyl)-5-amino-4-imidazole-carboxylate carboxylase [Candidatus Eisenbacteria bacterium]
MHPDRMRQILEDVQSGVMTADAAMSAFRRLPFESLNDLRLDHHRHLRCGFPEVVFGLGKTPTQVLDAAKGLQASGSPLLVTRVDPETGPLLQKQFPAGRWNRRARCFILAGESLIPPAGLVGILCAGTSDLPVAEEAVETARAMGAEVEFTADVGIAGLHRLSDKKELLLSA